MNDNNHLDQDHEAAFSDDEDEIMPRIMKIEPEDDDEDMPLSKVKLKKEIKNSNCIKKEKEDELTSRLNIIIEPDELKRAVENLYSETDNESRCQIMETIVQMIIEDDVGTDMIAPLSTCLSTILESQITASIFPTDSTTDEALTDTISTPVFVMFRNFFQLCQEEDNRKKFIGHVLAELQKIQPRIGYLLLYFLKV